MDSLQFDKSIQSFVNEIGKDYKFYKEGEESGYQYYQYKNSNDDKVSFIYYKFKAGENKNLEIKGIDRYGIKSISGKFLDVFPIWKKFVDPNSVAEEVANREATKKITKTIDWKIRNYDTGSNFWVIEIHKHEPKQDFKYIQVQFTKNKKSEYDFKTNIPNEIQEKIKEDFSKDNRGTYTAFYDVFYLDDAITEIKLKARLNR
ncbi:hypothetical protein D1002_00945 [Riemerella anatipestifer]|nr:hypothetical protein [Riemerella anatipestifer]